MLDIAFINARIVDGTGTPWQRGCVGVHEGRIVQVGIEWRSARGCERN